MKVCFPRSTIHQKPLRGVPSHAMKDDTHALCGFNAYDSDRHGVPVEEDASKVTCKRCLRALQKGV